MEGQAGELFLGVTYHRMDAARWSKGQTEASNVGCVTGLRRLLGKYTSRMNKSGDEDRLGRTVRPGGSLKHTETYMQPNTQLTSTKHASTH